MMSHIRLIKLMGCKAQFVKVMNNFMDHKAHLRRIMLIMMLNPRSDESNGHTNLSFYWFLEQSWSENHARYFTKIWLLTWEWVAVGYDWVLCCQ